MTAGRDLRDHVEHVLRFVDRPAPYHFTYSSDDTWEGCRASGQGANTVVVRWFFRDQKRKDFELRAALLEPVAAWLGNNGFAVTWHNDAEGPSLHVRRAG